MRAICRPPAFMRFPPDRFAAALPASLRAEGEAIQERLSRFWVASSARPPRNDGAAANAGPKARASRHCERSDAIQSRADAAGLLRDFEKTARNNRRCAFFTSLLRMERNHARKEPA
jgi:hypothetical protein